MAWGLPAQLGLLGHKNQHLMGGKWVQIKGCSEMKEPRVWHLTPGRTSAPHSDPGLALPSSFWGDKAAPVLGMKAACGTEGWDGVGWILTRGGFELGQNW